MSESSKPQKPQKPQLVHNKVVSLQNQRSKKKSLQNVSNTSTDYRLQLLEADNQRLGDLVMSQAEEIRALTDKVWMIIRHYRKVKAAADDEEAGE